MISQQPEKMASINAIHEIARRVGGEVDSACHARGMGSTTCYAVICDDFIECGNVARDLGMSNYLVDDQARRFVLYWPTVNSCNDPSKGILSAEQKKQYENLYDSLYISRLARCMINRLPDEHQSEIYRCEAFARLEIAGQKKPSFTRCLSLDWANAQSR